jgi:hypothetical protein
MYTVVLPVPPKRMEEEAEVICPVPPLVTGSEPSVSDRLMPKEEVANAIQEFPSPDIKSEEEAKEESPVPPKLPAMVEEPITEPFALVVRMPERMLEMAKALVVALVARRLGKVEVAVVVAVKYEATVCPTTESLA